MRSNNFFDQFDGEIAGTAAVIKLSIALVGAILLFALGIVCF